MGQKQVGKSRALGGVIVDRLGQLGFGCLVGFGKGRILGRHEHLSSSSGSCCEAIACEHRRRNVLPCLHSAASRVCVRMGMRFVIVIVIVVMVRFGLGGERVGMAVVVMVVWHRS